MRLPRFLAGIACALIVLGGCGGGDRDVVTGVVVDVTGDLTDVERFVVRLPDGTERVFATAPGVRFHDGGSIGHLRDHLRSAVPVAIRYEVLDDGTWVALEVDDAG